MDYYNDNTKLSIIHFNNNFDECQLLFEEELKRKIELHPEITILSNCNDTSFLKKQCEFNQIKICKLDFKNILNILNNIPTKYVLLVVGDAMLLENLSSLTRYDFLMCGNNGANSKYFPINRHCELMNSGVNKFANQNMIFARKTRLIDFFEDFFNYCKQLLGVSNPYLSKNSEVLFNLWYSEVYIKYPIDSEALEMTTINRGNYNVREDVKDDKLVRFVASENFIEKEFSLI